MLGERQVAAPLMAPCAANRALRPANRRFQPGEGVGVQLAGLPMSRKPHRPSQCQFGHETLVLGLALIAPAALRPGQHCAVRRQRGRQVAPCGHASTVRQRNLWLVHQTTRRSGAESPVPPAWRPASRPVTSQGPVPTAPAGSRFTNQRRCRGSRERVCNVTSERATCAPLAPAGRGRLPGWYL
jgi:hypothetical protein